MRLNHHLEDASLHDTFQSAYKKGHNTETAPSRIHNDILRAIDDGECVILVLLHLSAAFDTVDHDILITRLKHRFGITGKALGWIQSYLSERTQFVKIGAERSSSRNLFCGISQGSVLGPILYSMYTSPLTYIVSKHNMNHHFYADDSQIYLSFKPSAAGEPTTANCALSHAFTMLTIGCQPISCCSITTKLSSLFCTSVIDHNPRYNLFLFAQM